MDKVPGRINRYSDITLTSNTSPGNTYQPTATYGEDHEFEHAGNIIYPDIGVVPNMAKAIKETIEDAEKTIPAGLYYDIRVDASDGYGRCLGVCWYTSYTKSFKQVTDYSNSLMFATVDLSVNNNKGSIVVAFLKSGEVFHG